ncbi:hypothetical protein [Actinoplanes utahensis]|uniref:Uncharacterized protein n=1 Tax=Actinoplanes utahensis TaxID=1869 RepID=A0A0A6UCU2_ACTUT|nr:hypothetical protein [Actinoplanes utahensis]KHD72888.1 hypothetical protein MB27_37850 [Actinoplanes utahensis]GIF35090.1 hypothetical protein Aut01nite_80760 [Actinoplanes utahensis]
MRLSEEQLRAALRAEAEAHTPDREAMLDRISMAAMRESGSTRRHGPAGRRGPRVRMAAVAAAVVAILGGGGVGTWALAGADDRDEAEPAPTVAPATTVPGPPATAPVSAAPPSLATTRPSPARTTASSSRPPTTAPTTTAPSSAPVTERPRNTRESQGPLWSDGSIDPDSGDTQGASVITLKTAEELTALEVVIRVARTDGLVSRGGTKQTPGASVTTSVTEEPGALLYRFTLASADTLAPGTYTFTAKYTHPSGGRDAAGDTYRAVAATGSASLDVYGDFF